MNTRRPRINFVSNLGLNEISGGFSGMNAAAYEAIQEVADVHYVGPVKPRIEVTRKLISKWKRIRGQGGEFFFFSEARLRRIAEEVQKARRGDADVDFYHGFTPWILTPPARPYLAWSDCCFRDYIESFHRGALFDDCDLRRIYEAEAAWMSRSEGVLFSSEWARARTEAHYGLSGGLMSNISIFGALSVPPQDTYSGSQDFLFVSTNYLRKNGPMCREAMNHVWSKYPNARLKIIGARPRPADLNDPRVTYEGYLDKARPEQLQQLKDHFSKAFALVHPTGADTTAMVVIEAGFHGCPSITVNNFALPEVTGNGEYAFLLDPPFSAATVANAMLTLLTDRNRYLKMRAKAREFTRERFSRRAFKTRLQTAVFSRIEEVRT